MRYKFYREHKYVSFALNDLEREIARTDFCHDGQVNAIAEKFETVIQMLMGHAEYEDRCLHSLLKAKGSTVSDAIENDHEQLDEMIADLRQLLQQVQDALTDQDRIESGYQFYLQYRKFVGENLIHLHEEETIILPELQRLYTDDELRKVEAETYAQMTTQDLVDMVSVLFAHMNPDDHYAFLYDIKLAEPEKFAGVAGALPALLGADQARHLLSRLG